MTEEKKVWFPIRKMGWGFPCCWQGWVVFLIYAALLAAIYWLAPPNKTKAYGLGLTVILTVFLLLKGGRRGSPKI
jgi:uncharacterized BrkB/YihY/UPF0761 family membrane protein